MTRDEQLPITPTETLIVVRSGPNTMGALSIVREKAIADLIIRSPRTHPPKNQKKTEAFTISERGWVVHRK
jgi:hypothetical protein